VGAGRQPQSVIEDLNDQEANEDRAYRDFYGGRFDLGNIQDVSSRLVYQTGAASSSDAFVSNVVLHGSILFPTHYNLKWFFQLSNSSATDCGGCLKNSTSTSQQSTTASGILQYLEISQSTTASDRYLYYFYQIAVVINDGQDTEEAYCGNVVPYPASRPPTKQPTPSPTPRPTPGQ